MQHKRRSLRTIGFAALLFGALAGLVAALAMTGGAPQRQEVEKELDAKAFLGEQQ